MEKKSIVARIQVTAGKEADFLALTAPLIEGTRAEEGNISYTLYQNPYQSTEFIFFEEYKGQEAVDAHAGSNHFQAFAQQVKALLDKDMDIQVF